MTEVHNVDEIFGNKDNTNPPTPYFLVYIHGSKKDFLVDPVYRDIVEDQQVETPANDPSAMEGILTPNPIEHAHWESVTDQQAPSAPANEESQDANMKDPW